MCVMGVGDSSLGLSRRLWKAALVNNMSGISALILPLTSCIFPYGPNPLRNSHAALPSFQETKCCTA